MASASIYQGQLARNLPPLIGTFSRAAHGAQRALQFVRSTPGIGTALVGMKSVRTSAKTSSSSPLPVPGSSSSACSARSDGPRRPGRDTRWS